MARTLYSRNRPRRRDRPLIVRRIATISLLALLLAAPTLAQSDDSLPIRTVGLVFDGPSPDDGGFIPARIRGLGEMVRREALALTRREFDLRFPEDKQRSGDWDLEKIGSAIDELIADPDVDIVLAIGVYATNDVGRRTDIAKPVIAPFAIDIRAQGFPIAAGDNGRQVSGVANLSYVTTPDTIKRDLQTFVQILPLERITVIADALVPVAIPEIPTYIVEAGDELGVRIDYVVGERDADEILNAIPENSQAVYIAPLLRMPQSQYERLLAGLIDRRLPSFSLIGRAGVEQGVMAGLRADSDLEQMSRRIALNIQRILQGENASGLPVVLDVSGGLTINQRTTEAIGVHLRWRTLIEADLLYADEDLDDVPPLEFYSVIEEAVRANLDLRIVDRELAAGEQDIARARSGYRPSVTADASGVAIDESRAARSFGSVAERTGSFGLRVGQVIYSDRVGADIEISKRLQQARVEDREAVRLDIALEASVAFLDVLRAQTLEQVTRKNLELTRSHLRLAQRRRQIGVSSPAEVYRWQSRIATDRSEVIRAQNLVLAARVALNRVLHRPLEQRYRLVPPDLQDPRAITCCDRLDPFVEGPETYAVFREFSVAEGMANSRELRALDETIAAQERALLAARRTFWAPTLFLQGDVLREFWRSGAGSQPAAGMLPVPEYDRNQWSLALQASLPLYSGGARSAEVARIREELAGTRLRRDAVAERIEAGTRAALFAAGSTFPSIELAQEAAAAAGRNLELVSDAYSRGTMSIIDLLDAQNAALISEVEAENVIYDFEIDLMQVQRATSTFDYFRSEEGRRGWYERLRQFFEEAGMPVRESQESDP